jgi:NAD(P)-dependent dehydrogenase (short-subunit alcohol dehydrogenase family)
VVRQVACVAGIAHLLQSLGVEVAEQGIPVGVHCLSPGMVLTNLLLEGASDTNKQVGQPFSLSERMIALCSSKRSLATTSRFCR